MRDMLFKNITSTDRKRRIIVSSETADKQGVRTIIRRHFICIIREVQDGHIERPLPYLCVLKEHKTKEQKEKFFCKLKGSICAISNDKLYLILFMHSLSIKLAAVSKVKCSQKEGWRF